MFESNDIFKVEIVEDDNVTTSHINQAAGALIGGALFGGLGAVVGGLSGNSAQRKEVSSIELRVTVNDLREPTRSFMILFSEIKIKKDDEKYKTLIEEAVAWSNRLEVLMKRAERKPSAQTASPSLSVSEEIKKFAELRDAGLLTEDEFQERKSRLLCL